LPSTQLLRQGKKIVRRPGKTVAARCAFGGATFILTKAKGLVKIGCELLTIYIIPALAHCEEEKEEAL
jgi:hypothetical protein